MTDTAQPSAPARAQEAPAPPGEMAPPPTCGSAPVCAVPAARDYAQLSAHEKEILAHLHAALSGTSKSYVKLALAQPGMTAELVSLPQQQCPTPLLLLADSGSRKARSYIKLLLEAGARADAADTRTGRTALHGAARHGDERLACLLGARQEVALDAPNCDGYTPFHLAVLYNHVDTCAALLALARERGVELALTAFSRVGNHALHLARSNGMLAYLLSIPRLRPLARVPRAVVMVDGAFSSSDFPLHAACASGLVAGACLLLDAGADIGADGSGGEGDTALYREIQLGNVALARVLAERATMLGRGDLLSKRRVSGDVAVAPLHVAVARRDLRMVTMLARAGAPIDQADAAGDTPLAIALSSSFAKGAAVLRSFGAAEPAPGPARTAPVRDVLRGCTCGHHLDGLRGVFGSGNGNGNTFGDQDMRVFPFYAGGRFVVSDEDIASANDDDDGPGAVAETKIEAAL